MKCKKCGHSIDDHDRQYGGCRYGTGTKACNCKEYPSRIVGGASLVAPSDPIQYAIDTLRYVTGLIGQDKRVTFAEMALLEYQAIQPPASGKDGE